MIINTSNSMHQLYKYNFQNYFSAKDITRYIYLYDFLVHALAVPEISKQIDKLLAGNLNKFKSIIDKDVIAYTELEMIKKVYPNPTKDAIIKIKSMADKKTKINFLLIYLCSLIIYNTDLQHIPLFSNTGKQMQDTSLRYEEKDY